MKTILLTLVLLIALSTAPLLGAAGAAPEQVVDISGKKVRAGVNYKIRPVDSSNLFFTYGSIGEDTCPYDVLLGNGDPNWGIPVVFTPVNAKKGVIRVNTDLNFYYSDDDIDCPNSNVWKLKDYDYSTRQWFVTTGGVVGNPGRDTIVNWFKIEKYEDAYKLSYCPSVCKECNYPCMDVGIYDDPKSGIKRLALSYVPYKVRFQLAPPDDD